MKRCLLQDDGIVSYYLHPDNSDLVNQEWISLDFNQNNLKNKGISDLNNLIINTTKTINLKNKKGGITLWKLKLMKTTLTSITIQ